jgi:hypothetical protein
MAPACARAVEARHRPLEGMLITGNGGVHVRGTYGRGLVARALTRRGARSAARRRRDSPPASSSRTASASTARSWTRAADGATVRGAVLCRTGGAASRIRVPAQVTIAADGRRLDARLRARARPPSAAPRRWAVGAYFEGLAGLDTVGEMHVRGPHYIGVSPIGEGGLANVCLVTPAREGFADPAGLLERHLARGSRARPRAVRARRVHRAVDPRPARRRRTRRGRAGPAPGRATPPASSIR